MNGTTRKSRGIVAREAFADKALRDCRGLLDALRGPREQALRPQPAVAIDFTPTQSAAACIEDCNAPGGQETAMDRLALPEPPGLFVIDDDLRPRGHSGFDWQQAGVQAAFAAFCQRLQRLEGPHPRTAARIDPEPPQLGDVGAATEQFPRVADQTSNVGPRAAFNMQAQLRGAAGSDRWVEQVGGGLEFECMHVDLALVDVHRLTPARLGI